VNRALFLTLVLSSAGFAQEIGTEISPVAPTSSATPTEQGATARPGSVTARDATATATAGTFGIRAGFGSSSASSLLTASGSTVSVGAPFVGASYLLSNSFKLLVDLGFGLGVFGSGTAWSLGAAVGFELLFRTPADALRPLVYGQASFGLAGSSGDPSVRFGVELGGGAEYFLSPSFAIHGKIGLAVPMTVAGSNFVLGIFTLSPGLGATFYF
jgi:hypothetical protein